MKSKIILDFYTKKLYNISMDANRDILTKEFHEKSKQRQLLLLKISEIINKITSEDILFNEIDKCKLLETISKMLSDISVDWDKISDEDLFERTKRILILESMSGMLRELTPEQMEIFEETIERRTFLK